MAFPVAKTGAGRVAVARMATVAGKAATQQPVASVARKATNLVRNYPLTASNRHDLAVNIWTWGTGLSFASGLFVVGASDSKNPSDILFIYLASPAWPVVLVTGVLITSGKLCGKAWRDLTRD